MDISNGGEREVIIFNCLVFGSAFLQVSNYHQIGFRRFGQGVILPVKNSIKPFYNYFFLLKAKLLYYSNCPSETF